MEHLDHFARIQAGLSPYSDFYTDEDVINNSPMGWPSMTARQAYFPNFSSQRAFGASTQQVLTYYQQKIHCIDNKLDEMNFEDSEAEGKPLRSLPFNPEEFIARCAQGVGHLPIRPPDPGSAGKLDRAAQRENLMDARARYVQKYHTLVHMQHENKKFPRVSRRAHEEHFEDVRRHQGLDNEALAYMRYIDDFISNAPDHIFQQFESLLCARSSWARNLLKYVCCLFRSDTLPSSENDDQRITYSLRPFRLLIKTLLVISSQLLLIIPVALLYLQANWSRGAYLGIVVACSAIFAIAMVTFQARNDHLLVGVPAYYAVLVAFLANVPNRAAV
ncbi:uncharacterized protein F4807DRAFT_405553 [Annulohypoxylon truncatum]|uniref:uncharacterized protein n=1 Tax=Annulohypoxylon truncatum TaxID=327061 RepID=UPI002007285E|nr:uncharacterized protein F4807DRAFT_405553 [Annulohypoxylon truncatum]KAI1215017.1 hypothetical protein F4807DRAFT_405553 [Annulohypoxylon truncatum]